MDRQLGHLKCLLTDICRLPQTSIGDEADSSMKPLGMLEDIQRQGDLLPPQLRINGLQRVLHAQPEIDFLRSCTGSDITRQFGHRLYLFDPRVDIGLQLVQKGWIREKVLRFDGINGYATVSSMTLRGSNQRKHRNRAQRRTWVTAFRIAG